jgi:6-phosphofructokinase
MTHRILIAQGGGPTAVINQSLVGAVLAARGLPSVERVYGARHGVRGIVNEDFIDLTMETTAHLERVAATPASALGSTRDKPDLAYCKNILEVLKAHQIGHFFYIGGNDSSDTVRIVAEEAKKAGHPLAAVHIPKTIDNDLMGNDHTPGFPSAARFVMQAFAGANLDNAALPGVYVAVVMGRHAGFLTAAGALARTQADDGPHLVYVPERVFEIDKFLADVKAVYDKLGRCVVAVSEGIHDASGNAIASKLSPTATCSSPAPARWPICCAARSRPNSASSACAATPSAICNAAFSAASAMSMPAKRAMSVNARCSTRCCRARSARWRSAASATTPSSTCCSRWKPWLQRRALWRMPSSTPPAMTSRRRFAITCGRCWAVTCRRRTVCAARRCRRC